MFNFDKIILFILLLVVFYFMKNNIDTFKTTTKKTKKNPYSITTNEYCPINTILVAPEICCPKDQVYDGAKGCCPVDQVWDGVKGCCPIGSKQVSPGICCPENQIPIGNGKCILKYAKYEGNGKYSCPLNSKPDDVFGCKCDEGTSLAHPGTCCKNREYLKTQNAPGICCADDTFWINDKKCCGTYNRNSFKYTCNESGRINVY